MPAPLNKKYLIISCVFHVTLFLALVLGYNFLRPTPVIKNSNKHDVIHAVVLGDTIKSKILPHEKPALLPKVKTKAVKKITKPIKKIARKSPKPTVKRAAPKKVIKKKAIALKASKKKASRERLNKKRLARKKAKALKKQKEMFAKSLLADIKKQNDKKIKAKKLLQKKFAKTLRQQSEESLRQQLLDEEIRLQGKKSRQMQGVVNKYKALILQAIAENWIVPIQADKELSSELMIRLAPGGTVLDVQIIKTSGDPSLDSSARAAVIKSSPLPVPTKPDEFDPFRQFVLRVKPENIIEG